MNKDMARSETPPTPGSVFYFFQGVAETLSEQFIFTFTGKVSFAANLASSIFTEKRVNLVKFIANRGKKMIK